VKTDCETKCRDKMAIMRFMNAEQANDYLEKCMTKCEATPAEEEPVMCIKRYVDCDEWGGYDPRDPCN